MSNNNSNSRTAEIPSSNLSHRLDKTELKSIKVAIIRRNLPEPNSATPQLRSLDDPAQLKIHLRPDEGVRPIFDRADVVVNKINIEDKRLVLSNPDQKSVRSRSSSRSSSLETRSTSKFVDKRTERNRSSPQPHSSREYSKDEGAQRSQEYYASRYRRSRSNSRKEIYKTRRTPSPPVRYKKSPPKESSRSKRERSLEKSPSGYRITKSSRSPTTGHRGAPLEKRRSSRSPAPRKSEKGRYPSRSPPKYRGPPERRRISRSPPPSTSRSRRSRSRTPSYRSRSRYSRSPRRHGDYRRSRSPRKHSRYTPERHSRRSPRDERAYPTRPLPNPYFDGAEFWMPDPALHPFILRGRLPPGAFPYAPPVRPIMPMMIPPRPQFRPRIIYNSRPRPKLPGSAIEAAPVSSSTPATMSATLTEAEEQVETAANSGDLQQQSDSKNDENE